MNITEETITPQTASEMLRHNKVNRPIKKPNLDFLMRQMQDGSFCCNGEPIIFDEDSNLVDGQHRLTAIVKTGISTNMLIVRNVPRENARNYDGGAGRTIADQFVIDGEPPYHHNNAIIAAIMSAYVCKYDIDKLSRFAIVLGSGESLLNTELPIVRLRNWLIDNPSGGSAQAYDRYMRTQYVLYQYSLGNSKAMCKPATKEYYHINL